MVRRVLHTPKEAIVHKLCEYAADHATQKATILQQNATINILTAEMAALHSTVSQLQATFHLATEQARTEQQETLWPIPTCWPETSAESQKGCSNDQEFSFFSDLSRSSVRPCS